MYELLTFDNLFDHEDREETYNRGFYFLSWRKENAIQNVGRHLQSEVFCIYNPHFQISRESQTKRLNFEPFGKTKRSKIDKRTVQKKHRKNIFLQCFFITLSFGYLTKNH